MLSIKTEALAKSIFHTISILAKKHQAINLGQGYPDFQINHRLKELAAKYINEDKNQYCAMPGLISLREVLAKKYNDDYDCKINPQSEITITAGATQALFITMQALVQVDDEVIIIEPAYDSYAPVLKMIGAKVVAYRLVPTNDYKIDWDQFKSLVTERTRMIVINTPHNPIGKTFKDTDFKALSEIVQNKDITILSDEVYEHIVFGTDSHQSILKYPNLFHQSVAVYSFGKTFHATGWKMGYVIACAPLMKKIRSVHQWNVYCVNSFLQHALTDYLQDPNTYQKLAQFYEEKLRFFEGLMTPTKFKALECEGSYFQLYDYGKISDLDDLEFSKWLCKEVGVASIPLSPFYSAPVDTKIIRFCFAKKHSTIEAACKLLNQL